MEAVSSKLKCVNYWVLLQKYLYGKSEQNWFIPRFLPCNSGITIDADFLDEWDEQGAEQPALDIQEDPEENPPDQWWWVWAPREI